jgi:site-specific DNA-methyltransferase (adenine-specific)
MPDKGDHIVLKNRSGKTLELYQTDCIRGMNDRMQAGSVDLVVTSPPYNIGIRYHTHDDNRSRDEYLDWTREWAAVIKTILKANGSFFLNLGSKPSDPWVPFQVADVMKEFFILQNVFHWIKSIYIEDTAYDENLRINVGHYKPINSPRYVNDMHEYVFHFTHSGEVPLDRLAIGVPYKDKSNVARWNCGKSDVRCRGNVWYIPYQTIQNRNLDRPHPATFPPELAEMCLKLHGVHPRSLVLDPFMGLGNTALACQALDTRFVGFEQDPLYFNESLKRIKDFPV